MVNPERERAGKMAAAWKVPMKMASPILISSIFFLPFFIPSAVKRIKPVSKNSHPMVTPDFDNESRRSPRRRPAITAGTVPAARSRESRPKGFLAIWRSSSL
ncbi:Uncharacterised protein [Mycobacteroides abscessus subsp. abscessus]|nr:Uncharacterised protein [Mycobacteroides abscessus subsp. abscessus]